MPRRLPRRFYGQRTTDVARKLLGRRLARVVDGVRLSGVIVETEAYAGLDDKASHASRGRTPRTAIMYGPPGHAYIYCIYGMYHCLNFVTERDGYPAAVLVRAVEPVEGLDQMRGNRASPARRTPLKDRDLARGPGRLCMAMEIDRTLNGADLRDDAIFVEAGPGGPSSQIVARPRVGVDYAEGCRDWPWRFYVADSQFVSKR